MNKRILLILAFGLMVLAQLAVPGKMILDSEKVIAEGKEWRFRMAPIDPSDPFRGKYIVLSFLDNEIFAGRNEWEPNETIYVGLEEDYEGFARPVAGYASPPADIDYLKATVGYQNSEDFVRLKYPFDRLYMEESLAYPAEEVFRESRRDPNSEAWATVRIRDGEAVLLDVYIDGVPISELAKERKRFSEPIELE